MRTSVFTLCCAAIVAGCGDSGASDSGPIGPTDLGTDTGSADAGMPVDGAVSCSALVRQHVTNMNGPVVATAPPGDDRLFVAERQLGRVRIVDGSTPRTAAYLDLTPQGVSSAGFEAGILGLAFHPGFATTPKVYVSFTTGSGSLRVMRFDATSATADTVDAASATMILDVPLLETTNVSHVGGWLAFGPDGFLYVGVGDQQLHGDTMHVAQDLGNLRGKILRLDVDSASPYAVPPGNPFVGMAGKLGEIWAYGFREPYRFSFDAAGNLYVGDVGDASWEEIDVLAPTAAGSNLGWPIMEGMHCHTPAAGCDMTGLTLPVLELSHAPPDGASAILGGGVYAGTALPACYAGRYFFADYLSGIVRSFTWTAAGGASDVMTHDALTLAATVSLTFDGHGEMVLMGETGRVDRIVAAP